MVACIGICYFLRQVLFHCVGVIICLSGLLWMAFELFPFSELMNQLQVPSCAGLFLVNLIFAFLLGE